MVLSLASVTYGLQLASHERLEDSPRDLVVSSIGLEPTIENAHDLSYELKSDPGNFSGVMPMLTVIGKIAIPPSGNGPSFPPGGGPAPSSSDFARIEVGLVGLVPELASDLISGEELIVRSERIRLDGWFKEEADPYFISKDLWTSELLLDDNIMDEMDLDEGDTVYYVGQDGTLLASLTISGSIGSSIIGGGLARELVSGMGILHLSELQELTGNDRRSTPSGNVTDLVNAIYIDLDKTKKDPSSQREIIIYLEGLFPGLKVTSKESRLYRLEEEVLILQVFSYGVGLTTLFIGSLFLSSVMVLDVEDRRAEISVMRAIGISRRTIYLQILKDSLMISLLGALFGLFPAYIISFLLDNRLRSFYGVDMTFSVLTPGLAMLCLAFLLGFVSLFSILPGIRSTTVGIRDGLARFGNR